MLAENSIYGQDNTISEFDLYGCWKMVLVTKENGIKIWKYVPCDISETGNSMKQFGIVFKAYNKCEFSALIQSALCPIIYESVEGTWTYDKKSGIVEVYYPKEFQKEFWDSVKERNPDLEIPNPRMKTKFKIVGFEDGKMEIEKMNANIRDN